MSKLYVHQLLEGMVLTKAIKSQKTGDILLKEGSKLNKKMIKAIKVHNVKSVEVADRYTLLVEPDKVTRNELSKKLTKYINKLAPSTPEANTSDKMVEVAKKAHSIVLDILNNKDIINFSIRMRILDKDLLFSHSVKTTALALLIAGAMNMTKKEMLEIGSAALLHDIGLGEMPHLIADGEVGKPKSDLWNEHPTYGFYLAKEGNIDRDICRFIMYHHERWDGSGFPNKLKGEDIPLGSRIIAVAESYDTLTRYNNYKPHEAIEYLYGGSGFLFDSNVVSTFTSNLAVYPLGSMVRLSTKEVGVVVNVRKNKGPRPVVRVYYNSVNRPLKAPKNIDLGKEKTIFITEIV